MPNNSLTLPCKIPRLHPQLTPPTLPNHWGTGFSRGPTISLEGDLCRRASRPSTPSSCPHTRGPSSASDSRSGVVLKRDMPRANAARSCKERRGMRARRFLCVCVSTCAGFFCCLQGASGELVARFVCARVCALLWSGPYVGSCVICRRAAQHRRCWRFVVGRRLRV